MFLGSCFILLCYVNSIQRVHRLCVKRKWNENKRANHSTEAALRWLCLPIYECYLTSCAACATLRNLQHVVSIILDAATWGLSGNKSFDQDMEASAVGYKSGSFKFHSFSPSAMPSGKYHHDITLTCITLFRTSLPWMGFVANVQSTMHFAWTSWVQYDSIINLCLSLYLATAFYLESINVSNLHVTAAYS